MMSLQTGFLTITLMTGVLMGTTQASAIEKPKHEVVRSLEFDGQSIEIRDYAPYLVAETVVESPSLKEASSEGFRRLAKYIFGGNRSRESMDMAALVFSGFWSDSNFSRRIEALKACLAENQIPAQSRPTIARYNMPLTPWFLRTNEILIDIPRP